MTLQRLGRLTGELPLRNRREEDVRRVILALARMTYEQTRRRVLVRDFWQDTAVDLLVRRVEQLERRLDEREAA